MPTVVILGAGASHPYGFPLGRELRDLICGMGDTELQNVWSDSNDLHRAHDFIRVLSTSGYVSVDAFLEAREEFVNVGKLAIALQISRLEDEGKLFPPVAAGAHCWYEVLANALFSTDLVRRNGGGCFENLKIITFNYDRSLERYLMTVANNRQGSGLNMHRQEIEDLIIHVHGSLGSLRYRPYIPNATADAIGQSSQSIQIAHEADDASRGFKIAKEALHNAKRIWFFGFGYYEPNMRRLGFVPGQPPRYAAKIWTQSIGMNSEEVQALEKKYGYTPCTLGMNQGASINEALRTLLSI